MIAESGDKTKCRSKNAGFDMSNSEGETVKRWLEEASALIVAAGAGMGVDSGLPDYRGANGVWGQLEDEWQGDIRQIMTPDFLNREPVYCWQRFERRITQFAATEPHAGYSVLLRWAERYGLPAFVLTSNIDRQFVKAGFDPSSVWEMHGDIHRWQCSAPCSQVTWAGSFLATLLRKSVSVEELPSCPYCGALARPNVYLFNDKAYVRKPSSEQYERYEAFLSKLKDKPKLVVEIGAGVVVRSVRAQTRRLTERMGARLVRINPTHDETPAPHLGIKAGALEGLEGLDAALT